MREKRRPREQVLKTQGIDDALIQPYSGHATRDSLEVYSRIALADGRK
jgi:integrase/recombinase XerD